MLLRQNLQADPIYGRPDLRPGEYILLNRLRVAEPHDRKISVDVQKLVYERDDNKCQCCGWNQHKWTSNDPRILELHHIEQHAAGGANSVCNLITLCSKCHDLVHAKRLTLPKLPWMKSH